MDVLSIFIYLSFTQDMAQFNLYVHKGGLKPHSFYFTSNKIIEWNT